MADPTNFTNPLGGHEIVADVLAQIKKRLATDCNLRATDGYSGGYSGEVVIKLRCHAVRTASIDMAFPITQSLDVKAPSLDSFSPEDIEPLEIDESLVIPLEPNLNEVRIRTVENNQEVAENVPAEESEITDRPKRRKYLKHAAMAGAVSGE
jgi:hypothetical protein